MPREKRPTQVMTFRLPRLVKRLVHKKGLPVSDLCQSTIMEALVAVTTKEEHAKLMEQIGEMKTRKTR